MKSKIFRSFVAVTLALSLIILPSCVKGPNSQPEQEQEKETKVVLTEKNIEDYIGTNLCFGEIYVVDMPSENTERISCVCYVDVFPIGEYSFNSATVTLSLQDTSFSSNLSGYPRTWWTKSPGDRFSHEVTIKLDKEGYGRTSIYLERTNHPKEVPDSVKQEYVDGYAAYRENYSHPLQSGTWSIKIGKASGAVTENK